MKLVVALAGRLFMLLLIAAILALGSYYWLTRKPARLLLITAASAFAVSLFLRVIDEAAYPQFPLGTPFLWHLLAVSK